MLVQIDHNIKRETPGDSEVNGGYTISKLENNLFNVHVGLEVKKFSRSGTAYGLALLLVELAGGVKQTFGAITETVGADVIDGFNRDYSFQDYRTRIPFEDYSKVVTWYLVLGASESRGYPTSIDDLKNEILDKAEFIRELAELATGESKTFGDYKIFRSTLR